MYTGLTLRLPLRIALCASLLSLSSCGESVSNIKGDVDRLENDMKLVRNFQAEHTAAIDELRSEIRTLSGKLEEYEYSQKERIGRQVTELQGTISSLQQRVPPPQIVPIGALEEDETLAQSASGEAARFLSDALGSIRQGNFDAAVTYLRNGLSERRDEPLAPNMLFWTGVAFDGLGRYNEALKAYYQLSKDFPNHRRAPLSLLRQANTLSRMGDAASAKLTLKKLTLEFPKTEEAAAAAQRLRSM